LAVATTRPAAAADLVLFGAGRLREALTQITRGFAAATGVPVRIECGRPA